MPAALVVKAPEVAVPPLSVMGGEVKAGVPVQVGSVGGKSRNVTVPVGLKPVTVAVSLIAAPTVTALADGVVAIVAVAGVMVTGSTAQPEVTVLPMSPLEEVKTGVPLQVVSVGGKSWNVIEPVGLKPPLKVAVSWIVVPTGPPAEGVVPIVGVALVMVTGVQAVLADGLLTSPFRWRPSGR